MKALIINGSPHKMGQTAFILEKMNSLLIQKGFETKIFFLDEMNINGCKGCFSCQKQGVCSQKDDMEQIYAELDHSDLLVVGTPIYMWQMNGQCKIFTDRLFQYYKQGQSNGKRVILSYTYGRRKLEIGEYINFNSKMFSYLGFSVIGVIDAFDVIASPVQDRQDITNQIARVVAKA
jgi:multimeric flavodoxin WrbA